MAFRMRSLTACNNPHSLVSLMMLIIILCIYHTAPAFSQTYGSVIYYKSIGLQSSATQTTNQAAANRSLTSSNMLNPVQRSGTAETINPPFRACVLDPTRQDYSDTAIYRISGTATLGKLYDNQNTLRYLGNAAQNLTIMMINNMTTPLSGMMVVNGSKSIELEVQHITTQCGSKFTPGMNSSALRAPYANPRIQDLVLSNPPFRLCTWWSLPAAGKGEFSNSALYTIKGVTESQLPNDFPSGKQNITITMSNNFLTGEISGKLLLNHSKSIGFSIVETHTVCSSEAF